MCSSSFGSFSPPLESGWLVWLVSGSNLRNSVISDSLLAASRNAARFNGRRERERNGEGKDEEESGKGFNNEYKLKKINSF